MLKRGDHGPAVTSLQNDLLYLGAALPRWGADGSLGDETLAAAADVLLRVEAHLPNADTIDDVALEAIAKLVAKRRTFTGGPKPALLIDRRATTLAQDRGPRPWSRVKGVCLHQTACHLGASKDIARCDNVAAHFVVYQDGRIFQLHDLDRVVWHGNGWNGVTVGIEIDGLFAGIEGDASTVWDDPSTPYHEAAMSLTDVQAEAVRQLVRWIHGEIIRNGGTPTLLVAHRQSSGSRQNDPGSKVWQDVALPLMAELSLTDGGPGSCLRDGYGGRPIPEAWDPSRKGIRYL